MEENQSAKNIRIAKNTFFLYLRMFLMMGISLYTSRIVLSTLGEVDYGLYNGRTVARHLARKRL